MEVDPPPLDDNLDYNQIQHESDVKQPRANMQDSPTDVQPEVEPTPQDQEANEPQEETQEQETPRLAE